MSFIFRSKASEGRGLRRFISVTFSPRQPPICDYSPGHFIAMTRFLCHAVTLAWTAFNRTAEMGGGRNDCIAHGSEQFCRNWAIFACENFSDTPFRHTQVTHTLTLMHTRTHTHIHMHIHSHSHMRAHSHRLPSQGSRPPCRAGEGGMRPPAGQSLAGEAAAQPVGFAQVQCSLLSGWQEGDGDWPCGI